MRVGPFQVAEMGQKYVGLDTDAHKPDGLTVITPERAPAFLDALPIERFFGVGGPAFDSGG